MTTTTEQLILSEIKEFRADVTAWQIASEGRLSSLETQMKTGVTGNGQPRVFKWWRRALSSLAGSSIGYSASLGLSRLSRIMFCRAGSIRRKSNFIAIDPFTFGDGFTIWCVFLKVIRASSHHFTFAGIFGP